MGGVFDGYDIVWEKRILSLLLLMPSFIKGYSNPENAGLKHDESKVDHIKSHDMDVTALEFVNKRLVSKAND